MTKIVLDAESFKALASDTRLQIIKALDARPLTVSELSRLLTLNKATVFEHLKQLMAAELTKRDGDPARKWVYYRLTWKGRNILHPENAQIFLMLSMAAAGFGGAIFQVGRLLNLWLGVDLHPSSEGAGSASSPAPTATGPRPEAAMTADQSADSGSQPRQGAPGSLQPINEEPQTAPADEHWYDFATNQTFLTIVLLAVLLVLIGLVAWTLYKDQRSERLSWRERIAALPAGVNALESQA